MEIDCVRAEHKKELATRADIERKLREEVNQLDAQLTRSVQAAEEASEVANTARKNEQDLDRKAARAEVTIFRLLIDNTQ